MVEPTPPPRSSRNTPRIEWFDARVDHFDASNTDTFPMRFYYNDELTRTPSPEYLLVMVGGEWAITPDWVEGGLMYETGEELGAGLVYSEHRYYGLTRPTQDTSTENLRYLTADQALADLTQLLHHLTSEQFEEGRYRNARIALVGCSYAGTLATWARIAAPHRVVAAFSNSGPVHAQEDFPEYLEVLTQALRDQGGASCVQSVEQGMAELTALLDTAAGRETVSQMFGTCAPLSASPLDRATFSWYGVTEVFASMVQYAIPGQIPAACAVLNDTSVAPVQRLANWITTQSYAQPCIEARYDVVLAGHTNTSYDAPDSVMRLWTYQTCVEFGWYQTTSSSNQPFLSSVPLDYFHQMCRDFFGPEFDEQQLRSGIARTNLLFGSRALPDRVVTLTGDADPWFAVGPVASDATPQSPVYVVPGASHCRAMGRTADAVSPEMLSSMEAVKSFLVDHLTGPNTFSAAAAPAPLAAAALAAVFVAALVG